MDYLPDKAIAELYGGTIIRSANESNFEDAYRSIIPNIKEIYGFPDTFIEKAKDNFVSINNWYTVKQGFPKDSSQVVNRPRTKEEIAFLRSYFDFSVKISDVFNILGEAFIYFADYDIQNKTIICEVGDDGLELEGEFRLELIDEDIFFKKIGSILDELSEKYNNVKGNRKFIELRRRNWESKASSGYKEALSALHYGEILDNRYKQIGKERADKLVDIFGGVRDTFFNAAATYHRVNDVLETLAAGKKLITNCNSINYFLSEIDHYFKMDYMLLEDNTIKQKGFYLQQSDFTKRWGLLPLKKYYMTIHYCLLNFLKIPAKYSQLVRKCKLCQKFYLSKRLGPSKWCSDKCKSAFHNKKRIQSGEHARYKREKRQKGEATIGYY